MSQLHAYYRVPRATRGFPTLFMGKTFAVYVLLCLALQCSVCDETPSFFLNLTDLPHLLDLSNFFNHSDLLDFLYLQYLAKLPDHPGIPNFLNHPDLHTASLE